MKTAAKVLLILAIIGSLLNIPFVAINQFIWIPNTLQLASDIIGVEVEQLQQFMPLINSIAMVATVIGAIIVVTLSSITLHKIKVAKSKDELVVWGVLDIIFCGIVPGILVLLIKSEDLDNYINNQTIIG